MRIVSLLSSATEILFAVGAGDQVIGIGHECDWPPEATFRPRVTRSWIDSSLPSDDIDRQVRARMADGLPLYEVDGQQLTDLAPDLIVTQAQCDVCAVRYEDVVALVERVPSLRATRIVALEPQTLEDIFTDVLRVGVAVDRPSSAEKFVRHLRERVAAVSRRANQIKRPRTVCIEWTQPLMLAANWTPTLIELAGGEAGLVTANAHSTYATWEALVAYDPEVLLISPCGFALERSRHEMQRLLTLPGWRQVSAVRAGRVALIDGNAYLSRSGPRIVDSLEIVAHAINPAIHPAPAHGGWEFVRSE
jgi:iron complex transport system substrate-binding protein